MTLATRQCSDAYVHSKLSETTIGTSHTENENFHDSENTVNHADPSIFYNQVRKESLVISCL